jgi:superfamily II DNA or RNA helicase
MNSDRQHIDSSSSFSPVLARIPRLVGSAQPAITPGEPSEAVPPAPDTHETDVALGEDQKPPGEQELYHPAVRLEIPAVPTPPTETTDGYFKLRSWQVRCFAELTGHRNFILNAPMAAGKTFELCAIAAERLCKDSDLRVIIAAPQGIIVAGFRDNKIEMPDGTRVHWEVDPERDLCDEKSQRNTASLLSFLAGPACTNAMDRVILCTHATLVRAFGKDPAAFKNVLIIIDEAHHVQHGTSEDRQVEIYNKLGGLVKYSLQHRDVIQLGLATATFFRGDRTPIIPDGAEFARFDLAYDEYLETCRFLRGFSYDFVISGGSFVDPIKNLFDRKIGKTIVYIPAVNSSSSLGTKGEDVNAVLKAIAGTETPILADTDQPIMRVKRGEKWINVVNLVDEEFRAKKAEAIIAAHRAPDSGHIDVVIALGMLKEGANWQWADREIIIGQRGSLTELLQMVGRILRDVSGKANVEVFHLLPFRFDQTDKEQTRQNLNDYLKAILLSMLLENVVSPAYLPAANDDPRQDGGRQRINYLKEAFADEGQATAVLAEITSRVVEAAANDSTSQGIRPLADAFPAIVSEVLSARGVHEHHEQIGRQLFRMFSRRTVALEGLNVGRVDVDLIRENPFGFLLQYASDACGIKTFGDLRLASCTRAFLPFDRARAFVHNLQLESAAEWRDYCGSGEKPEDIPTNPHAVYEHEGWVGYGDWLGTGRTRDFRSFPEARLFVRGLRLNSVAEWREYCASGQKPPDIPSAPERAYEGAGWASFPDWLGAGHARRHRGFLEARGFVHALGLKSRCDWEGYCKSGNKPADIPSQPDVVYRGDGWNGYGDWLGTGKMNVKQVAWRPFQEAREFVRGLGLNGQLEWVDYCKSGNKPPDIPTNPNVVYREAGWSCYRDWLGFEKAAKGATGFLPFCDAREYVRKLGLNSFADWREYCKSGKRPANIPSAPARTYKDLGWKGWGDWLGTGTVGPRNHVFRSFDAARLYVRTLGLTSGAEWRAFCKSGQRPSDIPSTPDQVYKDAGWDGFNDWLMGESGVASAAA